MAKRTRKPLPSDNMSETEFCKFRRELHSNKLTMLVTDLERIKLTMAHIFGYKHADSKLIDDIIQDMEEAKVNA